MTPANVYLPDQNKTETGLLASGPVLSLFVKPVPAKFALFRP